jgi:putative glutathione S-transferase
MTVVDPLRDERGWAFRNGDGHSEDPINRFSFLSEAYHSTEPTYRARYTVPVLWDKSTRRIVSNSDDDMMRMLNSEFNAYSNSDVDLYPPELTGEIDRINDLVYTDVNNGVYRAGFATTQSAYSTALKELFDTLDQLEELLDSRRYIAGERLTEADWRLFPTLIRFDAVYHGHFKCNIRRIVDYPNLWAYVRELYQVAGIAATVDFDHIKRHYYITHDDINPPRIVPEGPIMDLMSDHGRGG